MFPNSLWAVGALIRAAVSNLAVGWLLLSSRMKKICTIIIISLALCGSVWSGTPPTQIFDTFGDVCCNDEKARLDNFALALQHEPEATGYIIFYGGRRHYPFCSSKREMLPRWGESRARAARLKPYLVNSRGIDRRVVVIDGGFRETWTADLWIVPKGASPPTPTPTVKPEDIRYRKGRIRKRDYECEV